MSAFGDLVVDLGAMYLGLIGSAILFGVTNLQVYNYFMRYPNDSLLQKFFVASLWLLDGLHFSFAIHSTYYYLVSSWGRLAALFHIPWSLKLQIAFNITVIVFIQALYAIRAWKLGLHFYRFFPCTIILLVLAGSGIGIFAIVEIYRFQLFVPIVGFETPIWWAIVLALSAATSIDLIIAIFMCFCLQRSCSGFTKTRSKMIRLMQYIVGSGITTSACSLATLVTYLTMAQNIVFLGIELLLPGLYVNSYIAMLNIRGDFQGEVDGAALPSPNRPHLPRPLAVEVCTSTHVSVTEDSKIELGRRTISSAEGDEKPWTGAGVEQSLGSSDAGEYGDVIEIEAGV